MNFISNKNGSSYVRTCVIVIVLVMILSAVMFYAETMTIVETTKENTEMVLDSFIMKNSIEIYDSIKQGHDWTEKFDENYYFSEYSSRFSLDFSGNCLYNYNKQGDIVYYLTNPNVTYKVDKALKLKVSYTLFMPVRFAGKTLYWLRIPLAVTSSLTLNE